MGRSRLKATLCWLTTVLPEQGDIESLPAPFDFSLTVAQLADADSSLLLAAVLEQEVVSEIIFVDSSAHDYQALLEAIPESENTARLTEVVADYVFLGRKIPRTP